MTLVENHCWQMSDQYSFWYPNFFPLQWPGTLILTCVAIYWNFVIRISQWEMAGIIYKMSSWQVRRCPLLELLKLAVFIKLFAWFQFVSGRYTSEYAHFISFGHFHFNLTLGLCPHLGTVPYKDFGAQCNYFHMMQCTHIPRRANVIFFSIDSRPHVLVHCVKSIRAYNVKSSSTLFPDNIQWNFEIPFPCARFKRLLGCNLITKKFKP